MKLRLYWKKINLLVWCLNEYGFFDPIGTFFLSEISIKLDEDIIKRIYKLLNSLTLTFNNYFPNWYKKSISNNWVQRKFNFRTFSKYTGKRKTHNFTGILQQFFKSNFYRSILSVDFWLSIQMSTLLFFQNKPFKFYYHFPQNIYAIN